ncbi:MAG: ATP-binding protein [Verrucomicrobia bacterium]|nr:ATP-binding protein [Verrucomicrobiota bacterium]
MLPEPQLDPPCRPHPASTQNLARPRRLSGRVSALGFVLLIGGAVASDLVDQSSAPVAAARRFDPLTYRVRHWTSADGLGGDWTECVTQTRDDYLWIGTPEGLVRFDGFQFHRLNRANCPAFDSEVIKALMEDSEGALWVATKRGLLRFLGAEVRRFEVEDGLAGRETSGLCSSTNGVWVSTSGGVSRFQRGVWQSYTCGEGDLRFVHAVLEDRRGRVWVGQADGLRQLDPANGEFTMVLPSPFPPGPGAPGVVRCLLEDRSGAIWIGTDHGIFRWRDGQIEPIGTGIEPPEGWVKRLYEDANGRLWAVIGFMLHSWNGVAFEAVDQHFGLADQHPNSIFEDSQKNLWITSRFAGLTRLKPTPLRLLRRQDGLQNNDVHALAEGSDGALWVATATGLDRLKDGRFEVLPEDLWVHRQGLRSVVQTRNGEIWLTTTESGSAVLAWLEGRWRDAPVISGSVRGVAVLEDLAGDIWWGGIEGLSRQTRGPFPSTVPFTGLGLRELDRGVRWVYRFDRIEQLSTAGHRTRLTATGEERLDSELSDLPAAERQRAADTWVRERPGGHPASYDIRALLAARDGGIWLGTARGLSRLRDWRFEDFPHPFGPEADSIRCLHEDDDGTLWLGTDGGLIRRRNEQFTRYGMAHALGIGRVHQLLEDDAGHLWLGCPQGIVRVARAELHRVADGDAIPIPLLLLDETDGLRPGSVDKLGHPSVCRTPKGQLWFATSHGLARIDPKLAATPPPAGPIHVERVVAAGMTIWERPIVVSFTSNAANSLTGRPPPLRLPPGSGRSLELHYSALDLSAAERVRFRHRLEGLDADWRDVGGRRVAYYSGLPPGNYRFEVARGDPLGRWEPAIATLSFTLVPYFYQTAWFWTAVALGLTALGYALREYRARFQQRLWTAHHELALERQRSHIARDLHDGLGANISQIALAARSCRRALPLEHPAIQSLDQIDEAHRRSEEELDDVHWATYPGFDSLRSLVIRLRAHATDYLGAAGIECHLDLPEQELDRKISAESRYQLLLAFKEILRNIVRHAHATRVEIRGQLAHTNLTLRIRDDGRGFDPDHPRANGNGLRNLESRVTDLGGRLTITSRPAAGTTIELSVPVD